jgi:hypothetical protein
VAYERKEEKPAYIEFTAHNISEKTIATVWFEATFLDVEGNVLETVKHKETNIEKSRSRAVYIKSTMLIFGRVKSYTVRITRIVTADVEKVQLRRQETKRDPSGAYEVIGTAVNISNAQTDAAVIADFYNQGKECIGTRVLLLKNIEPGKAKAFKLFFKPQEGDKISSYELHLGDITEEL